MEYVELNTGAKMPMMGFGVFRVPDLKECEDSVYEAIKIGYRLIDTATAYANEEAVGAAVRRAIADGICTREDLFVTSKLWVTDMKDYDTAMAGIDAIMFMECRRLSSGSWFPRVSSYMARFSTPLERVFITSKPLSLRITLLTNPLGRPICSLRKPRNSLSCSASGISPQRRRYADFSKSPSSSPWEDMRFSTLYPL